jgi:hypothetical protein
MSKVEAVARAMDLGERHGFACFEVNRFAPVIHIPALTPNFPVDADALLAPFPSIQDQIQAQIMEITTSGVPCTVTAFGKALYTVHPDGSIVHHESCWL